MSYSKLLLSLFLFFFITFASSSSSFSNNTSKCSVQQAFALLQFKENLSYINDSLSSWQCKDWLGSGYYPKMMNWNKNRDCCKWDGITCDHFTGDVIGIDLSCSKLQGIIHLNTTLFQLPHLQTLNLAFNDFTGSQLPREIGRYSNSLTHLNLSYCGFYGEIPSEVLLLSELVSLDLSYTSFRIQNHVLNNLLGNSTHLIELLLSYVNISWVLPTYLNISSSLRSLDLSHTNLQGKLPVNIFHLQYLETLDLSYTYLLTGTLPNVTINQSSLRILKLSSTGLQGKLPNDIFNLQKLEHLDLSRNNFTGPLPKFKKSTKILLKWLDLSSTNLLLGEVLDSIGHLISLDHLYLRDCGLVGPLPKSLVNLSHLVHLTLSNNKLNGTLPAFLFTLPLLETIHLEENMFSGGLPSELYSCRSLKVLFDGEINQGSTPPSFAQLVNLIALDLSWNNFTGLLELDTLLSSLPNLEYLYLSYSGLSVVTTNATEYRVNPGFQILGLASCNLTVFPKSLRAMKKLYWLDLSDNNIHGQIPEWAGEIGDNRLYYLDLSHNSITGLPQFLWVGLEYLYLQSNLIQGPIPPSVCNMSFLRFLDMSNNRLSGEIPEVIGTLSSLKALNLSNNNLNGRIPPSLCNMRNLYILDMSNNRLSGEIPDMGIGSLEWLILKENRLEGKVPSSLLNCRDLEIIDLGNNHLNGTFPGWLGDLPRLQVLVLKSNNFHGPIDASWKFKLPLLQVLDLSQNGFTGHLPRSFFQNFNAMKTVVTKGPNPQYLNTSGSYYSINLVVKGQLLEYPKILVDFNTVDLSGNKFEGEIPEVIGTLSSLKALNLSHNNLNGRIPNALGNLSEIESLDLSSNQLTGEIPQGIAEITNLEVLNLSHNNLTGRIPNGRQFNTFDENSFGGNPGLCGFPLPKPCEPQSSPHIEGEGDEDEEEEESGFTWKVVMMGFGCGTLIGLVMGSFMLSTGRPKWFDEIADAVAHMIGTGRNKRRIMYIGK